jgi:hypothetical protein
MPLGEPQVVEYDQPGVSGSTFVESERDDAIQKRN